MSKPVIYIAGPYSSDPVEGTRMAIWMMHYLIDLGAAPITPHLTMLADLVSPRGYETWIAIGLAIVAKCDAVVRLDGESNGADAECKRATELGIPVLKSSKAIKQWLKDFWANETLVGELEAAADKVLKGDDSAYPG